MAVNVASGSHLSIATAPNGGVVSAASPPDQTAYEAMTWQSIGIIEDAGTVGDAAADITFESLETSRVEHFAGPFDAGSERVVCGYLIDDLGQLAVTAALYSRVVYGFKLELADRPSLDYTNTIKYYGARVLSDTTNVGNARNVVRKEFTLGINTPITTVVPQFVT